MNPGVLLAFLAYAAFSWGDAAIKGLGPDRLSVFEIGFFASLFTGLVMLFMAPPGERWRDVFRMRHPMAVLLRSVSGICAGLFGIIAFTTIPFAEAYALIFMAPFLVTLMSLLILHERITLLGFVAMLVGFAGVLIVIRPGLRTLELGHFAAAVVAFFVASSTVIIRRIATGEKRTSLLIVPQVISVLFNGGVAATHFVIPGAVDFGLLVLCGGFTAIAQFALVAAARRVPAGTIGQTQYSQLLWGIVAGALFFAEYPDLWAVVGVLVIVAGGIITVAERRAA